MRRALDAIQVLSDCGETKIRDQRITGVVHEDIWLAGHQYSGKPRFRINTHSLEVPVNHIAGVEVTEASGDVG